MTLGTYPLGTIALGAEETPEQTLTIQSTRAGLSSDNLTSSQKHTLNTNEITHSQTVNNVALIKVLIIQNTTHGLMSDMAEVFTFTPNPIRTHKATRTKRASSPEAENRTVQPTNNRTLRI